MKKVWVGLVLLVCSNALYAQKDSLLSRSREGFYIGVNFGGYFASDAPSQYYNGDPSRPNKVSNILSNFYTSEALEKVLPSGTYKIAEYPTMRYGSTLTIGGHLGYNVSKTFSWFAEINFTSLTASGNLKLQMDKLDPKNISNYVYKDCPIVAKESRADINIGARTMFAQNGWFLPFIEYGINLNIQKVQSQKLHIANEAGLTYDGDMLMYYSQYSTPLTQGANGYGVFLTAGGLINMPSRVHLHIGVQAAFKKIGLSPDDSFLPHAMVFLRCNY